MTGPRLPVSTYRVQLNKNFTFAQAGAVVDYLYALGITDAYTSPFFTARPGSTHGYDVTDPRSINPELGTEEDFQNFSAKLKSKGMGLLLDLVPNHMCIDHVSNVWWNDVLENGASSSYSRYFDIDWNPPKVDLANKVLLPRLGEQFGRILEGQEINVFLSGGAFHADYYANVFPLAPKSWLLVLELSLKRLKNGPEAETRPDVVELESIMTALGYFPPQSERDPEKLRERQREKEVVKKRIEALVEGSAPVQAAVREALNDLNGLKGNARSFDRLEKLLDEQAYRLCYWRVAADEINYRRFFDINELAAIRVEEPEVFAAVHELPLRLIREGTVTGLRVDHVDGLYDPSQYLADLQKQCAPAPFYIIAEKILVGEERLRRDLGVSGTTGYDFSNHVNGLFVEAGHRRRFLELYSRFIGRTVNPSDLLNSCKKFIMHISLSSELHVLASQLDRISEQHRWSRDFTLESLRFALREVIAAFPVYRSYIRSEPASVSVEDRRSISTTIREAKRRNPATSESIFDFIASVLLLEDPEGLSPAQIAERRNFVMKFQQLTGPVMAKGLEDTAFYRYFPLASLNDVGGDLASFGVSVKRFHERNLERLAQWPHGLINTTTHDSKRSEDVRARINVLSEIPVKWYRTIRRWQVWNRPKKSLVNEVPVPDANEEYLLYQTLVGTWPLEPLKDSSRLAYTTRIQDYMIKALKEAKVHTSWINPNQPYEKAVRDFVREILEPGVRNKFLNDFVDFHRPVARAGMMNTLSQVLLKIASPGVPDFYQGTEAWKFALVDPDNRGAVDYECFQRLLRSLEGESSLPLLRRLLKEPEDGRIKMYVTSRALRFRRAHAGLFSEGNYVPLGVEGVRKNHLCAFARRGKKEEAIIIAARFFLSLPKDPWANTAVVAEEGGGAAKYRDIMTGRSFQFEKSKGKWMLPVSEVLTLLPVALLEKI